MKKRILVCDDDEGILEVLTIILQNGGYDVKALSSGKEVKKMIKEYHPDVLLLDVMMPEANGKDIAIELKKNKTIRTPIILLSAVNNFEQIARETGADDFMVKPFDMKALLAKVAKYAGS
jgi:DNA-binding response OmpR family regulator